MDGAKNLHQLTASSLSSIGGSFTLNNLIFFTAMAMDSLSNAGSLNFTMVPNLGVAIFDNKIRNTGSITIVNTSLSSLKGIEVDSVGDFTVADNQLLANLTMESITNMTGSFYIDGERNDVAVNFPNLVTATDLTFEDVASISLPSLASVTNKLNVTSQYISNFSAPSLVTGGSVSFQNSDMLTNISMPELKTLSEDLVISGPALFEHINGFPKLSKIQGDLTLVGNYTE